jgi:RNA-directed DNA polymerase
MFDEIEKLSKRSGAVFSSYVDDMTITGKDSTRVMGFEARKVVASYRLRAHKAHYFRPGQTKIVTGVALTRTGQQVPYRRQLLIAQEYTRLASTGSNLDRLTILHKLISRVCEASQVDPSWRPKVTALLALRQTIKRRSANPQ